LGALEKIVVAGERKFFDELYAKRKDDAGFFSFIPGWLS